MLGWIWNTIGMFFIMKLFMWDIPFMFLKFSYYMIKYTCIVIYYVLKFGFEVMVFIFKCLGEIIRIF